MLEGKLKLSKLLLVTLTVVMMAISVVSPATVFAQTNESAPTADPTQAVTQPHPNGEPGAGEPLGTGQSNNPTGDNAVPTEPAIEATPDSTVPTPASTEPAVNTTAPTAPSPDTPVTKTVVAKIGDVEYETLDEAVEAAKDGDIIEVLQNCTSSGFDVNVDLTIKGKEDNIPTIKFVDNGIAIIEKVLSFENCYVDMVDIDKIDKNDKRGWDWMAICLRGSSTLNLKNVKMTLVAKNKVALVSGTSTTGIYFDIPKNQTAHSAVNILDRSSLSILNYGNNGMAWNGDGSNSTYNCNVKGNSCLEIKGNSRGIAGTFNVNVDNSTVNVSENKGNGSNGTHFDIQNKSAVKFNYNKDHGLSAGTLTIDNSVVEALNNGYNGVHTNNTFIMRNKAQLTITGNQCTKMSKWSFPAALHIGGNDTVPSSIDKTSKLLIKENKGSGIFLKKGILDIESGANVEIVNNVAELTGLGGGVYNKGVMNLSDTVVMYNNHASTAGDDIYNNNTLSFENINEDKGWSLDGGSDCNGESHAIDGWYHDAEDNRWNAHISDTKKVHVKNYLNEEQKVKGYKAAHGINVGYTFVSGTEGKKLPQEVLDLLPVDKKGYDSGVKVDAKMPTSKSVTVSDGTWTFVNYKPNKMEGDKPEINVIKSLYPGDQFIGTWVFKPAYKVDYEFISDTEGKELPKEVLDLLPVDKEMYDPGEDVSAILPKNLEVKVPGGKWVFVDYDKDLIDNINSNGEFNGHWKYIADPVEETPKPSETPKPTDPPKPVDTPKPQPYDDGGPFTTDECGSVYDRWGNLMWKSPVCKVTTSDGYNMVNTADK